MHETVIPIEWSGTRSWISLVISLCAFIWPLIFEFMQRPRLNLLLDEITYKDTKSKKKSDFIRLLMINDGYRPIIISECKYWTNDGGTCHYGIYDELKTPYGVAEIVLPVLLEPAKTAILNLTHPDNINKITAISVYNSKRKEYRVGLSTIQDLKERINHSNRKSINR